MSKSLSIEQLNELARNFRREILQTIALAGSGHPGGSLSAVEILISLYYRQMRHNPQQLDWPQRDRFILQDPKDGRLPVFLVSEWIRIGLPSGEKFCHPRRRLFVVRQARTIARYRLIVFLIQRPPCGQLANNHRRPLPRRPT